MALFLSYLGEAKNMEIPPESILYLAVRKPVKGVPDRFIHLPALSPSPVLFERMRRWKEGRFKPYEKDMLKLMGIDAENPDAWWSLYEIEFKKEIYKRLDMIEGLDFIEELLKQEKTIYLFCYCKDVYRCHRSLLGNYYKEKGYSVNFRDKKPENKTDCNPDQMSIFDF